MNCEEKALTGPYVKGIDLARFRNLILELF